MSFSRQALVLSVVFFAMSCNHTEVKKQEIREPAATGSFSLPELHHIEANEIPAIKEVAEKQDSQRVHSLLSGVRIAQILASSFDARIAQLSKTEDADKLLTSKLYCRLLEVRPLQESIEDKLRVIYAASLQQGPAGRDWFYAQIREFAKVDTLNEVAMMQMVRMLVEDEETFCGAKACLTSEIVKWPEFRVNVLDDEMMANYVATQMAQYSQISKEDLKSGDCIREGREPNQTTSYDWKHRNWTGDVLPQGQFVFTYDDGPHPSYTKIIRDTWAQAGMVKPAFFWLSKNVANFSSVVKDTLAEGYVIGSHSVDHKNLGAMARAHDTKGLDFEINGSVDVLKKALGRPIRYFRLPYGSGVNNPLIGARFQALNLDHFFWRVDSLDWQDKNPASIRNRVVKQMAAVGRGIVLFHDIHPQSAKAAQLMVDYIKANPQYKAVSILDLPGLQK